MERPNMLVQKRRHVTPEKAIGILEKHGVKISIQEAEIILDLLYNFAKLAVYQEVNIKTNHNRR